MSYSRLMTQLALACWLTGSAVVQAASVEKIGPGQTHLLPHGKEVDAIYGDYLLRSDKIAAVIGGVAAFRDANVNTQAVQGAVIDLSRLDLRGGDNDLLTAYYPHGHYLDSPGPTNVAVVQAEGAEAVIRFTRAATRDMQGDPVDVETEYRLRDGEPYLHIKTVYYNRSGKTARAAIYDKMRADTLFRIPPAGRTRSLIYYEPWNTEAYAVVRAGGDPIRSYANPAKVTYFERGGNRLDFPDLITNDADTRPLSPTLPAPSIIGAGESKTLERFLIPGRYPADVQPVIAALLHQERAPVSVRVQDTKGVAVKGANVQAIRGSKVISEGKTDTDGEIVLSLDNPSAYDLLVEQQGRENVRVHEGAGTIRVGPLATAQFDIYDVTHGKQRVPVKVMIKGVNGTPDPDFGPDALAFQAGHLCFSNDGKFSVNLPAGDYEAWIGRGPEYTLEKRPFSTAYGRTTQVRAGIRRAFRSPGWVVADFHNHTTNSNDSIADPDGRVVGIAANGIEFAPATEHNRISSFAPYIEEERLTPFLHSTGSIELSGRPGPGAINHQIAFPLRVSAGAQGGGAPATDKDPKVQMGRLYHLDHDSEKFVQQNHPDIGWLYFDKNQDGKIDGGFGTRPFTQAMELNRDITVLLKSLEMPAESKRPGRGFEWLQMLNQEDRIYGSANSDAHVTAFNDGSIFTWVKSETDDPGELVPLELARAAKAGKMVMSNGPFLEVALNGVLPGGDFRWVEGATLKVRVQCADWMGIDRVQVLVNGRPDPKLNFTRVSQPAAFDQKSPVRFQADIPLHLTEDAHIIAVAAGEHSHLGPFHGPYASMPPTAVSNPIFVDVDGGGFQANHDTLGNPLPVASEHSVAMVAPQPPASSGASRYAETKGVRARVRRTISR